MRKVAVGVRAIEKFVVVLIVFGIGLAVGSYVVAPLINAAKEQTPMPTTDPLHDKITAVKNRLQIVITQPGFTNPVPVCDFYEYRQMMSDEYYQLTVDFDAYQHGKGTRGDIEAQVEIYNVADLTQVSTDLFTVEVSRRCWNQLTVYLDRKEIATFPSVTENNVVQYGYITFQVSQP